jgi:uncharacterized membrane protein YdjX (TVP38/TMEM64 family)
MQTRTKIAAGGALIIVLGMFFSMIDLDQALSVVDAAWTRLQSAPAPIYFSIMTVAILLPVPASVFYVTAGSLYGVGPSLLWIAPTLALNALLVHQIAGSWLRPMIEGFVSKRDLQIPRLKKRSDEVLFITLIRITPGIPYFVQSWVIGLADVARGPFLGITLAIQMLYAAGFVVLGRSIFDGEIGIAIGAIALLVFVSIVARVVHKRFRARSDLGEVEDPRDSSV